VPLISSSSSVRTGGAKLGFSLSWTVIWRKKRPSTFLLHKEELKTK
jgi:hypothetical protein